MDETYVRVKGRWTYLYRAVDRDGQTLDLLLSERRDLAAARRFFRRAIAANDLPDRVVIGKSGANLTAHTAVDVVLKFSEADKTVQVLQIKFLNTILAA